MQRSRLGCLSSAGIIAAVITAFVIVGYAFASGGQMFSPGALNAVSGQSLGGVSSHAEIAGACSACHVAPWEKQTMQDRCLVCHQDVPVQMLDLMTPHGRMFAVDPTAECRDCHPEHNGKTALLTDIEGWKYPHELSGYFLNAHQFKAKNVAFKCVDCHGNDVTTFEVKTCTNCHGQIDQSFAVSHILAYGEGCLNCHNGMDSIATDFSHESFQFKLSGKHVGVACGSCHTGARDLAGFKATPQDCVSCHGTIDPHGEALGPNCASCHTTDGWKPAHFDHNTSAFKLTDAHVNVACESCHVNNVFKGTPGDCFSCHREDDFHKGTLGQDCGSCHKPSQWKEISFDHSKAAFPLAGKHNAIACTDCHKDFAFKGTPSQCASCHADAHSGQMGTDCAKCHNPSSWKDISFDHSQAGFPLVGTHQSTPCASCHVNGKFKGTPANCFACHASKDAHKGQFGTDCGSCHNPSAWKNVSFDHSKTGFSLAGGHADAQCVTCHVNGKFKGTPTNCYACHASKDVHKGQFGTDCGSCHNPGAWKNVTFDHSKTSFPLAGGHVGVQCSTCHVNGVYRGTPKECVSCHASKDPHAGQFGTVCSTCHNTSAWKNVTFNHGNTAFPLSGSHTTVACKSCHVNNVYKGTPKNCYGCHAGRDKHNGQFGTDCGSCHKTTKWSDVSFNHNNTAFPLSGKHSSVQCGACHTNGVYKGTPSNCYACHASKDKHNGQFGTNCGSCHTTNTWTGATFNHNNTAFPLSGKHSSLQCSSCHANGVYKGTPSNCYACHASKDKHNGQFGTNCGSCHTTNSWTGAAFNHNNTSFPLVGKHTNLECTKCHRNGVYKGTSNQCIACHEDKHNGEKGTDCGTCHTPTDWGKIKQ